MSFKKRLLNNVFINNIALFFRLEKYLKSANSYWKNYHIQPDKTHREVAGYSNVKEMEEVVESLHRNLRDTTSNYIKKGASVLDIGCGPGLFLMDFGNDYDLTGIDLSDGMLKLARQNIPSAIFYEGDFLTRSFEKRFSLIYFIGVLQYFSINDLDRLFGKVHDLLEEDGIVFISYPHAISAKDLSFPDLNYVSYSPAYLNTKISSKFKVLSNKHIIDNREVGDFDKTPYKPSIPGVDKIYKNSSILIAQKRSGNSLPV